MYVNERQKTIDEVLVRLKLKSTACSLLIFWCMSISANIIFVMALQEDYNAEKPALGESTATCPLCGSTTCHQYPLSTDGHLPLGVAASGPNM